jgi:hypothetical protein
MNRKILMLTVTLIAVSMLAIPAASACTYRQYRLKCMDYKAVILTGPPKPAFEGYPKYWPSKDDPKIITNKIPPTHLNFKMVIGDETYIQNNGDFTYDDGYLLITQIVEKKTAIWTWKWTITFNKANTGIDGTLEMWLTVKFTIPFATPFDFDWSIGGGYGTGDLRGVYIKAVAGTGTLLDMGGVCTYHEGTVYNWPS